MIKDPIVEEVRKTREKILEKFDYDIKKYIDYIIEKQNENKDRLITKPFVKEVVNAS
jgi:hypothetical protein